MNAFEIPGLRFSLPAGEAIGRYKFVTANSDSEGVLPSAGGASIGISMNQAAEGEVLEITDGIAMVEAAEAINAGQVVETDANGKALVRSDGIALGVALTAAGDAGEVIAIKAPIASGIDGAAADMQIFSYAVEDLDAGADLSAIPFYVVPAGYVATVKTVQLISKGTAEGVDADNTAVVDIKVGASTVATKTFDGDTAFPAKGVAVNAAVTAENAERAAGDVLALSITNGATANLPAFMVQIAVTLAKA